MRGLVLLALYLTAVPVRAQEPPPPVRDTLAADTVAQDTVRRALIFPAMPVLREAGPVEAVWVWSREDLLREAPLSVTELLQRIPGVTGLRAGMFVQPEAASGLGGTAGRVQIELDGYIMDPLAGSTFDLSAIPLGQLRELRVERRLGLLRIRLFTDRPVEGTPFTRVEAGVGQPPANLFRGLFLVPYVIAGPLALAVERVDTDGLGRAEPANVFTGWGKWAWTNERRGVQAELIRSTLRREPNSPWQVDRVRQDLVVRARNVFAPGLVGELYAGRAWLEQKPWEPTEADTAIDRDLTQAGARVTFDSDLFTVGGAFRYRDLAALPRTEASAHGRLGFGPALLWGELNRAGWEGGESATAFDVHGQLTAPFGGSVFAQLTGGRRGAPDYRTTSVGPLFTERDGWRVGAALSLGNRATGTISLINLDQDQAIPFVLPFDSVATSNQVETARGIEASGRLVLLPGWLAIESWITNWTDAVGWTYLPVRSWRTVLELHTVPLPSGNLEILGRLEGAHRSGMLAYNPEAPPEDPQDHQAILSLPAFTVFHAYLQIRIIDVRIFLRWEDLTSQQIEDLPGRFHRGQRIMYGVKWNLWN